MEGTRLLCVRASEDIESEGGREGDRERRTPASCLSQRIFEDEVGRGSIRQKGRKTENEPPLAAPRVTGFKRLLNEVQNDRHVGPMLWQRGRYLWY